MKCNICWAENQDGVTYCTACGGDLRDQRAVAPEQVTRAFREMANETVTSGPKENGTRAVELARRSFTCGAFAWLLYVGSLALAALIRSPRSAHAQETEALVPLAPGHGLALAALVAGIALASIAISVGAQSYRASARRLALAQVGRGLGFAYFAILILGLVLVVASVWWPRV